MAVTVAAVAACSALPPARMGLPETLAAAEPVVVRGLGFGRSGDWRIDELHGRFERGADRLRGFYLLQNDMAGAGYTLHAGDGATSSARGRGRQTTLTWGVVAAPLRPWGVACRWDHGGELTLAATTHATRDERVGHYRAGGVTLELRSVHHVQGSPLALEAPIGYLLLEQGRAVGAIELNGSTPRLWRPPAGSPLVRPVIEAALALALLWDPAGA